MAKKRLKIRDRQGNVVDYDIAAASVTIDVEGKSLEVKLTEIAAAILEQVKRVVYNGNTYIAEGGIVNLGNQMQPDWNESSTTYPAYIRNKPNFARVATSGSYNDLSDKPQSVDVECDEQMSSTSEKPVQNKVIKAYVDNLVNGLINNAPAALDTLNELAAALGNDSNFAATVTNTLASKVDKVTGKGLSTNDYTNAEKTKLDGLPTNPVQSVSVETNEDGTVDFHVDDDTYKVNLNHTHAGMAKLVKCTEATLPQTLENDTIYVQVDNATTPTEIESLYLFGLEFTGGGLPAGVPQISKPTNGSTVNLGTAYGQGGATGTVKIKGRSLTANSTVVVSVSSGFSLSYGQQSGSSINIDAADVVLGCDVTVYAAAYGTEGAMTIVSQTDNISVGVELTSEVVEELAGVKLTGAQWLETDYSTNPQTKIVMDCQFGKNSITENQSYSGTRSIKILECRDGSDSCLFVQTGSPVQQVAKSYSMQVWLNRTYDQTQYPYIYEQQFGNENAFCGRTTLTVDAPNALISFQGVSWATDAKNNTQTAKLTVAYNGYNSSIFNNFDLSIYSLKLYDGATLVREYVPRKKNGVVGMLDTVGGGFISSKTSTPLEAITSVS